MTEQEDTMTNFLIDGCFIKLNRVGRRWVGPCPFHDGGGDYTFSVSEDGLYYCYACGAQGEAG